MKNLVRNHKFLVSFAVLSILAVGCSSKQPASEKLTNNNKSSEIITSKDKVENNISSKINVDENESIILNQWATGEYVDNLTMHTLDSENPCF